MNRILLQTEPLEKDFNVSKKDFNVCTETLKRFSKTLKGFQKTLKSFWGNFAGEGGEPPILVYSFTLQRR